MAVRAIRGAVQLDADERTHMLASVAELVSTILERNELAVDDQISIVFTATPDLHSEFPAVGARDIGITDVPLLCAQEINVAGAMPRVIRILAHAETERSKADVQHVYLRGAVALRKDIAQ
ncbi:MAG TPA: chorismate mutase [Sporichthyaceae bacterium]